MSAALSVCLAVALAVVPVLLLAVWTRRSFTGSLTTFRCRTGPPAWRPHRRRWRLLPTRAAWARDVLLVRRGPFHLGLEPIAVGVARTATVRSLGRGEARGLGEHPVCLALTTDDGRSLEVAVAKSCVAQLVGPFLTVLLNDLPPAPRDQEA